MPAIGFVCPDGLTATLKDCFTECRIKDELPCGRCKALPYLRKAASQREWTGEPSTTQLMTGTREAWLKITRDYYINPDDRAFAILGTSAHGILDRFGHGDHLTEERLRDEICSGAFDFYDGDSETLYDYKTSGSYKIQGALGMGYTDEPETDPFTEEVLVKTRGKNKGQAKTKRVWNNDDIATRGTTLLDFSIQLSNYRDKLKAVLPEGYTVKRLAIQFIARDGGLMVSTKRGIEQKAPLVPVNGISSHWIRKYFARKRELLFKALQDDHSPICRHRERWYGRKCQQYCDVREACIMLPGWEGKAVDIEAILQETF